MPRTAQTLWKRLIAGAVGVLVFLQLSAFIVDYLGVWFDRIMLDSFPELFLDTSNAGTVDIIDNLFWGASLLTAIIISYWINDKLLSLMNGKVKK